jgi:hypothetical protein
LQCRQHGNGAANRGSIFDSLTCFAGQSEQFDSVFRYYVLVRGDHRLSRQQSLANEIVRRFDATQQLNDNICVAGNYIGEALCPPHLGGNPGSMLPRNIAVEHLREPQAGKRVQAE